MTSSSASASSCSTAAGPAVTGSLWTQPAGLWTFSCVELYQFVCPLGPIAQQRPGVAGIDDLLGREALGGAERRADRVQALLDLRIEGLGVVACLELAAVRGIEPAGDR